MSSNRISSLLSVTVIAELKPLAIQYEEKIELAEKAYSLYLKSNCDWLGADEKDILRYCLCKLGIENNVQALLKCLCDLKAEYQKLTDKDLEIKLSAMKSPDMNQHIKLLHDIATKMTSVVDKVNFLELQNNQLLAKVNELERHVLASAASPFYNPRFAFSAQNSANEGQQPGLNIPGEIKPQ